MQLGLNETKVASSPFILCFVLRDKFKGVLSAKGFQNPI